MNSLPKYIENSPRFSSNQDEIQKEVTRTLVLIFYVFFSHLPVQG